MTKLSVFTFPVYEQLAKKIISDSQCVLKRFSLERFSNKELHLTLLDPVLDQNCVVLGTFSPPEVNLVAFLILCHTLKKENAKKVTGVIPYLSYSRHEKVEPQKSQITSLLGMILASSGLDEIITIDIHNPSANSLFPFPIHSLSPAKLFVEEIKRLQLTEATIVAPDKGAFQRCKDVAEGLRCPGNLVLMTKTRGKTSISHENLQFEVKEQAIVIDDILDTGKTLISCCEKLLEKGVKKIIVMVTHGLFTGKKWQKLFSLGVKKIYCTNTIDLPKALQNNENISVIPIDSLIASELTT